MGEVFGIDVSHHQGAIDWKKVARAGIKFAIMKCQYESASHRIDERFEANYLGAGQNGIKRGVYIYVARASLADIEGDANSLLRHLKGRPLEYGIWLDLEDASVAATGKGFIRDMSYKYAKIFKSAGYYVGIYSNKDWYSRLIHDDLKRDFDFWFARYPRNDVGQYNPTSTLRPSSNIAVAWQYSSKGHVDGIKGYVDLDVDYDGIIDLMAAEKSSADNPYNEPISNVKNGMIGIGVMWVQWQLNVYGYGLAVDGIFGPKTEEAVRKYQKDHGLTVDGVVGPKTRASLKED